MDSEVVVDACSTGLVPDGGLTYALAQLPWHLGEFLALTGWPVRGADLVYIGLVKHWVSHDALPFLELTAEKHLEVSEHDSRVLLLEHSLPVPPGLGEQDSVPRGVIPLVADAFSRANINEIADELKRMADNQQDQTLKNFASDCLRRMEMASPIALHVTLRLIQEAKRLLKQERPPAPGHIGGHGERGALVQEEIVNRDPRPEANEGEDFAVCDRSEFPFSQHPRLRRYHPDYNPKTGLDHDPAWMAQEVRRWSPDLFADRRQRAVEELLGGRDPSRYGLSRWVRVDG